MRTLITGLIWLALAWALWRLLWRLWIARRITRASQVEESADWFGKTGLDEGTERELPRYLRREFGEAPDEEGSLRASDLHYLGVHRDAERGPAHFWRVARSQGGEPWYAYVEVDQQGGATSLGWGDREPPTTPT
jgi:hypothetical protein